MRLAVVLTVVSILVASTVRAEPQASIVLDELKVGPSTTSRESAIERTLGMSFGHLSICAGCSTRDKPAQTYNPRDALETGARVATQTLIGEIVPRERKRKRQR